MSANDDEVGDHAHKAIHNTLRGNVKWPKNIYEVLYATMVCKHSPGMVRNPTVSLYAALDRRCEAMGLWSDSVRPTASHLSGSTFVFYKWVVPWGWRGTQSAPAASSPEPLLYVPNRVLLCWNLEHLRGKPTSLSVWRVYCVIKC